MSNMTPEAQRIAIAQICGWKLVGYNGMDPMFDDPAGTIQSYCPEYLKDLNAMHEAEKTAFDGHEELWSRYLGEELPDVCEGINAEECATASQRAEAFLRTLNLWKE